MPRPASVQAWSAYLDTHSRTLAKEVMNRRSPPHMGLVGENGKLELQMLKALYPRYFSVESAKKRSNFSQLQYLLADNIKTDSDSPLVDVVTELEHLRRSN